MTRNRMKLTKSQLRMRAKNRRKQAKLNKKALQLTPEEYELIDEIGIKINDWSESKDGLRIALRNFIDVAGEMKAQFDKPHILLSKLGIDKNAEDMSYLYKLIRAVHVEFILNLKAGEVPYSVLAALPKRNLLEIWESANELKKDRPYPSEKDIVKAKRNAKKISFEEMMAEEDEYLDDVYDDSEGESNKYEDKATPNLRQTLLELSRHSINQTEIILNVLKYLKKRDLYKILTIKKNFSSTEIEKMIDKLMKEYLIVIRSQPNLSVSQVTEVSELYEEDIDLLEHSL